MSFGSNKRRAQCMWYEPDGTKRGRGCPRGPQICEFIHPEEPGFAQAPESRNKPHFWNTNQHAPTGGGPPSRKPSFSMPAPAPRHSDARPPAWGAASSMKGADTTAGNIWGSRGADLGTSASVVGWGADSGTGGNVGGWGSTAPDSNADLGGWGAWADTDDTAPSTTAASAPKQRHASSPQERSSDTQRPAYDAATGRQVSSISTAVPSSAVFAPRMDVDEAAPPRSADKGKAPQRPFDAAEPGWTRPVPAPLDLSRVQPIDERALSLPLSTTTTEPLPLFVVPAHERRDARVLLSAALGARAALAAAEDELQTLKIVGSTYKHHDLGRAARHIIDSRYAAARTRARNAKQAYQAYLDALSQAPPPPPEASLAQLQSTLEYCAEVSQWLDQIRPMVEARQIEWDAAARAIAEAEAIDGAEAASAGKRRRVHDPEEDRALDDAAQRLVVAQQELEATHGAAEQLPSMFEQAVTTQVDTIRNILVGDDPAGETTPASVATELDQLEHLCAALKAEMEEHTDAEDAKKADAFSAFERDIGQVREALEAMPASHAELQDAWETAQSLLQGVEETIIRLQTDDDSALVKFVAARRERVGDVVMRVARPVLDRILQDTTERLAAQNAATGADVAAYISPMVVWLHSNLDRLAAQKANPA